MFGGLLCLIAAGALNNIAQHHQTPRRRQIAYHDISSRHTVWLGNGDAGRGPTNHGSTNYGPIVDCDPTDRRFINNLCRPRRRALRGLSRQRN